LLFLLKNIEHTSPIKIGNINQDGWILEAKAIRNDISAATSTVKALKVLENHYELLADLTETDTDKKAEAEQEVERKGYS